MNATDLQTIIPRDNHTQAEIAHAWSMTGEFRPRPGSDPRLYLGDRDLTRPGNGFVGPSQETALSAETYSAHGLGAGCPWDGWETIGGHPVGPTPGHVCGCCVPSPDLDARRAAYRAAMASAGVTVEL